MGTNRWLSMTLVIGAAFPWALSLALLGMWILFSNHRQGFLGSPRVSIPIGVSALAAGQLVFLVCIADRVFPRVPKGLSRSIETVLAAILVLATLVLTVSTLGGGLG